MPTPTAPGQVTIWFLCFLTVEFVPVTSPIPPLEALIFLESSFLRLSSFFFLWPHIFFIADFNNWLALSAFPED